MLPRWSPRGDELFYVNADYTALLAVPVETKSTFRPGNPQQLFTGEQVRWQSTGPYWRNYDVAPDGRRFVVVQ